MLVSATGTPNWLANNPVGSNVSLHYLGSQKYVLTNGGEQARESHSLSTHLEGENFNRIKCLHGRPAERVADLEDIDPGKDGLADRWRDSILLGDGCGICDICDGCGDDNANPAKAASNINPDEHRATADFVDKGCADRSKNDLDSIHAELDVGLRD